MKHNLFKLCAITVLALFSATNSWADFRLNNPIGSDGYYIVKWDCEKNDWAESNDMEYDETFVLAIDLTGTKYEDWVKKPNGDYPVENTIVSLNTFRGSKGGDMYKDNRSRLWHIKGNIYGAMYNFAQFETTGWNNTTPAIGEKTKIYGRMFNSATLFSDRCYPIEPTTKKGSIWNYQEDWWCATDNQPLFVFAPYTGTKTGAQFMTQDMTPGTSIFYDNDHYVVGNGYAAPCSVNDDQCCPFFYPLDPVTQTVPLGADTTLVAEERSGNLTGVKYQWYRYETSKGESTAVKYTGEGGTSKICHPATDVNKSDYTYYCFITTDNCPDGVYTTKAQVKIYSCTLDESKFTITPDKTGKYTEGSQVVLTAKYDVSSTDTRTFSWTKDGLPIADGTDYTIQKVDNNTCKLTIKAATDDLAGEYICTVQEGDVADCKVATTYTLELKHCPDYTITVDGVQVTTAPTFYPGGWYKIACTSTAGNPTAMKLAAGAKAKLSHDTLYIDVDATTAPLTIEFPTAETADYAPCSGTLAGLISKCGEDEAYVFKWDDNKGYVVDNNGTVQMSTSVNDNTADRWLALPEGTQALGKDVVYLYNLKTNRYLYHGPVQTADNGPGDYSQALTSATLGAGNEYKWILYQGDQQRIYIMNLSNGTNNWEQDALVLHCRDWDYMYCQGNNNQYDIRVCKPDMKVGKMRGYTVSGEMHTSANNLKKVTGTPVHFTTTVAWNGTAPDAMVEMTQGDEVTNTISRTDALHSVNKQITYSSSDDKVAKVDAATGKVTAMASGTATITAKLEDAGCFDGAELTYEVHIKGCSPFTWTIDEEPGLSKLLYPGGWYMIHCTNEDGAPDITVSGTGITSETPSKSGNTTTVKVELSGDATGDITFTASLEVSGMHCEDVQTVTVSECTETAAESRKIEWFNFNKPGNEFPQYWIHGGASVFLRDNNGVLEADIEHQDGNDQWYIIYTGEKVGGQDVFYLQNVQTMRYVYRGSVHGNIGGSWEYAEALLNSTLPTADDAKKDYKWVLHAHGNDTAIVNVSGFSGTDAELGSTAYMLHVRNWEASGLFSNPNIPKPRMVCGKTDNQLGSPVFYFKGYTITKPITQFQTQIAWKDSIPDAIKEVTANGVYTYAIERTDDLHSINKTISYLSSNPSFATVDANGKVTIVGTEGEATIKAYLSDEGCFKGDTLSYQVVLNLDCPTYTWAGHTVDMYAGGWYEVTCATTAGAPTITVTGTDVTGTCTTSGNTTTVKVTLGDGANGDIVIKAENPLVGGYKLCPESVTVTIKDCPATLSADFKTTVNWQGNTPPAEIVATTIGQNYTYTIIRTDDIHSINSAITYESTNTAVATVDASGKVTIVASDGECDILAILEDVGCFKGDTLQYHVRMYDCTKDITTHIDYILPHQPKTSEDCSYIVLWDCANDTWAMDNTMEWGETFVFAINLAGTALGDWAMKPSSHPDLERTIAFDRFRIKNDEGTQFNLDASRLWHIRDTIFGAEFNFSQIPYTNGNFYTPAMGEQTEIAARLFGQETAKGAKCGAASTTVACNWWQWSDEGILKDEFTGEWIHESYVSNNDQYLFRFAPYTGKSDPIIKPSDDDPRDQWYDNHYFTNINGYRSPCPKAWPKDQQLQGTNTTICVEKGETATISLAGSETGWTYSLYKDGEEVSGSAQVGNDAALTWTELGVGVYTIFAAAADETSQHSDWMGDCSNSQQITITAAVNCVEIPCPDVITIALDTTVCDTLLPITWRGYTFEKAETQSYMEKSPRGCDSINHTFTLNTIHCERPEPCVDVIYRKWNDLLFVDNSEQQYTAYQWYSDETALDGETRQFLYTDGIVLAGDGKVYYCIMTLADGSTQTACANTFDGFPASVVTNQPVESQPAIKYIYNGRLYIRCGEKTYNGQGACVTEY